MRREGIELTAGGLGVSGAGRLAGAGRLERNAMALMVTTATTALLGLAFWAVAARFYSARDIGRGSALVASLTMLATLAQFNLGNVFARCLPAAGRKSRRFVFTGYAFVACFAVVLGAGFVVLGFGHRILSGPDRLWFPLAIAVLAVFALQDFVLISIQAARFIPLENVLFAAVKLVLLVLLSGVLPGHGIVLAWIVPAVLAVAIVSTGLYARGLPHRLTAASEPGRLPGRRAMGGIVAGEYVSAAVGVMLPVLLPLLVVGELGLEANAYFSVPWLVASSLNLLVWNIASSLLVEGAGDVANSATLVRRALRLALLVGGSGALVELLGARLILGLLGPAYAEQGTDLLRVLALAVPFNVVVVAWTTLMRIHNRMVLVVCQQLATGAAVLTVTVTLLPRIGITGVGIGYLAAQGVGGLVLAVPLWRLLRRPAPTTDDLGRRGLATTGGR